MSGLGGALASGVLAGGLHGLSLRLAWGWALAWIALVPLLRTAGRAPTRHAVVAAIAYAMTLAQIDVTPWLLPAFRRYFAVDARFATAVILGIVVALSVAYGAVLGLALGWRRRARGRLGVVWCAACWSVWEAPRAWWPPFFPVCVLGISQVGALPVLQLASVAGIGAVTALVAAVNAAIAQLWSSELPRRRRLAALGATVTVALAVAAWGAMRLAAAPAAPAGSPRVLLVDGDARTFSESTLERYIAATPTPEPRPALVVWPESAVWVDLANDAGAWNRLRGFVAELGVPLATGGIESGVDERRHVVRFNSVHVIRPGHGMVSYRKRTLVPFAESWPAGFGRPPSGFDPVVAGTDVAVFDTGGLTFGPLVCFEITDAPSARALARRGARLLLNVSNDAWFAGTAPHVVWATVRAVESGRTVARASNRGTSAIVDPFGRTLESSRATDGPAVLTGAIPDPTDTLYVRTGEVFLPLCVVIVVAGLIPRRRRVGA